MAKDRAVTDTATTDTAVTDTATTDTAVTDTAVTDAATTDKAAEAITYRTVEPLEHDGVRYEIGDPVDISDVKQAQVLLDLNVIEPVAKGKTVAEAE